MSSAGTSAIAPHIEAAKRLLRELEEQAEIALRALGQDNSEEFLTAVAGRDHTLAMLDAVVEALAHERGSNGATSTEADPATAQLLAEIARAAAGALESHDQLATQTRRERDRLSSAIQRNGRPDSVANQYGLTSKLQRPLTISITG
ncbi:MAG TPA: hypothetical protein VK636_04350 [Gemmatimonadaceae bacterium]|nr:hypothetical protein [Gemmatimonadaceae bacterium]